MKQEGHGNTARSNVGCHTPLYIFLPRGILIGALPEAESTVITHSVVEESFLCKPKSIFVAADVGHQNDRGKQLRVNVQDACLFW